MYLNALFASQLDQFELLTLGALFDSVVNRYTIAIFGVITLFFFFSWLSGGAGQGCEKMKFWDNIKQVLLVLLQALLQAAVIFLALCFGGPLEETVAILNHVFFLVSSWIASSGVDF